MRREKPGNWVHGEYIVQNIEKYLGTGNPIKLQNPCFRSSWEKRCCYFLDTNINVTRWGYEIIHVPYIGIDGKTHKYITDFYLEIIDRNGELKRSIWEVKPAKDGPSWMNGKWCFDNKPKKPKTNHKKALKNYMYAMKQYVTNTKKWTSVINYCKANGMTFKIITEKTVM